MPKVILFIQEGPLGRGPEQALMLCEMLGSPLLTWLTYSLARADISEFLLVCDSSLHEAVKVCFPKNSQVTLADSKDFSKTIGDFSADSEEQRFIAVTKPVIMLWPAISSLPEALAQADRPLEFGHGSGIYLLERDSLPSGPESAGAFLSALETSVSVFTPDFPAISLGSRADIVLNQSEASKDLLLKLVDEGVIIWDMGGSFVTPEVSVGSNTVLMPGTILKGGTVIGEDCVIGPNTLIDSSVIGDKTKVNSSQIYNSLIGSSVTVGPFAYVRPGCRVDDHVKIGDFVEIKNSVVGEGTKISHLTYVGDSDLGKNVNLGCGTVTVNFDGELKHRTVIEDDSFIGCNTNLISPVHIGAGAYIAAGSTITDDVPGGALGIARSHQHNREGWNKGKKRKD